MAAAKRDLAGEVAALKDRPGRGDQAEQIVRGMKAVLDDATGPATPPTKKE